MQVFVVIHEDRHADVEVQVFTTMATAIDAAKTVVTECTDPHTWFEEALNDRMRAGGWVYSAIYGTEGDGVRVVERTLQEG